MMARTIQLLAANVLLLFFMIPLVPAAPLATIPITFARGQIMLPARVNGSEPLSFLLDTGFSMTMLRPDLAQTLQLRRAGEITVEGIAGEERAPTYDGAVFDIGGARYAPWLVGAMQGTRRRRDGIIGSGLFRQYVIVVDIAARQVTLHSATNFTYAGTGEVAALRFRRSTPIIDASINLTNGSVVRGSFEVDTGCDSGICLGSDFTAAHHLLDGAATKSSGKFGIGGGAKTRSGNVPQLQIGALKIDSPETDFFLEGSPVDRGLAGHIGMQVLKQFRVIYDYPHQRLILERQ